MTGNDSKVKNSSTPAQSTTYTFADVRPDALDEIRLFQETFGAYFSNLLENEHETIVEHQWMLDRLFTNPVETINKSKFDDDLQRLRKAITTISEHDISYWKYVLGKISLRPAENETLDGDEDEKTRAFASEIFRFILSINEMVDCGLLPKTLDRYEEWARDAVNFVPDRRNINWDAVHAVSRLRWWWVRQTGDEPPSRALNPASTFASFLRDGFEFFGIKGDPISAFKRWAQYADRDDRL